MIRHERPIRHDAATRYVCYDDMLAAAAYAADIRCAAADAVFHMLPRFRAMLRYTCATPLYAAAAPRLFHATLVPAPTSIC